MDKRNNLPHADVIRIAVFQKNSFIDYPGKIACVIFLGGCNVRCYYCHNFDILSMSSNVQDFSEIISEIKEQKDFLDGVVISGGEPTMHPNLRDIINQLKKLGLPIKLDTNGTNPTLLKELVEVGDINYVAMDVKCAFENMDDIIGTDHFAAPIFESIKYLIDQDKIDYMFRTTLAPALDADDIEAIAEMIKGAKTYQMQQFIPNENSEASRFAGITPFTHEQVKEFAKFFEGKVDEVLIRGF